MPNSSLDAIRIVLVEPAGPLNVGSVARVMKNMGLRHLTLVNPHCDPHGAEARQMAVHAADVLASVRVAPTLPEGLVGCRRAIATTGRPRTLATHLEAPATALPWLLEPGLEPDSAALIFGPEDRGLNNEELNYAHRFMSIPANPIYPSLNLAQAVGICCYELYQAVAFHSQPPAELPQKPLKFSSSFAATSTDLPIATAPMEELESFYQQLSDLLLDIGYLYPHTVDSRMQKIRRLFGRAMPSSDEVAMLRGVVRQMRWAAERKH